MLKLILIVAAVFFAAFVLKKFKQAFDSWIL